MKKQKSSVVFACFSPPVMVATFLIETMLAVYTVYRYKLSTKGRAIVALLVCLAGFQLAEYFVCTNSDIATGAARAGYVSITFLPAIGHYLMSELTVKLSKKSLFLLTATTLLLSSYFLFAPGAFDSYRCTGNYVIFQIGGWQTWLYSLFYFGLIALSVLKGLKFLETSRSKRQARPVSWLLTGYAAFIVPVAVLSVFHPDTSQALPSVLCGFAVLLAIVLAGRVAPYTLRKK